MSDIPDPWWSDPVHVQYLKVKRYHEEGRQYPLKNNPGKSHSKPAQRDVCGNDSHLSGPEFKRNRPPAIRLGQCRSHESDPGDIYHSRIRDRNHNNRSDRGLQNQCLLFPLIIAGFVLLGAFSTRENLRNIGEAMFFLGLIFLSMKIMSDGAKPLKDYPLIMDVIAQFGRFPLYGILIGAIFTAITNSSSATTGLLIAMSMEGVVI